MRLVLRFFWMVIFVLGTVSCGFTPVYGTDSKTGAALSDIIVAAPSNALSSYLFVVEMEERIGRNPNGNKVLEHDILITERISEGVVGKVQLIGRVSYKVMSIQDNQLLFDGIQDNFITVATDSTGRRGSFEEARANLTSILANQVTAQLISYFSNPLVK